MLRRFDSALPALNPMFSFFSKLPWYFKVAAGVILIVMGYGIATWRHQARIAGYDAREQQRMASIAEKEAEQNRLRGENDLLRKDIAELSASEEGLKALIKERGGNIAAEGNKLEQINEDLKNDQTVINNPTDRCVRCRAYSDALLRAKRITSALTCKDECAGTNR